MLTKWINVSVSVKNSRLWTILLQSIVLYSDFPNFPDKIDGFLAIKQRGTHFLPRRCPGNQIYSSAFLNNEKIKEKNIWNNSFQTLNNKQWRMVIPKGGRTNEVSPMTVPGYCLEILPGFRAGKGNVDEAPWSSWVDKMELGGQESSGPSSKETYGEFPPAWHWGKNHWKGIGITTLGIITQTRHSLFPAAIVGKLHNSQIIEDRYCLRNGGKKSALD